MEDRIARFGVREIVEILRVTADVLQLFGGPRGVGGVFIKEVDLTPALRGGGQERGMRAGTENVAGFAAACTALKHSCELMRGETSRLRRLAAKS